MARKTPHCYKAGRTIPQGVKRVGSTQGPSYGGGLHDDDSECQFCFRSSSDHSKACPARTSHKRGPL